MDGLGPGCALVAAAAVACYAPSPPEGAPCSTGGDCPIDFRCDGTGRCTRTPADADAGADAPADAPAADLVDSFSRADSEEIGNGWIEKIPTTYSLASGEVVRVAT